MDKERMGDRGGTDRQREKGGGLRGGTDRQREKGG